MKILLLPFLTSIIIMLSYDIAVSQNSLTKTEKTQIDALFEEFSDTLGPGLSFGLLRNGKIIYTRNIGFADIDSRTPITSQTSFQLGELSRQFTAYAIILLVEEGKLTLEDPVINYLLELDIPATIKVKDLVYHSSGLDNFHVIKTLAGWYHERPYNQTDALRFIQLQKSPRYKPGTDFNYSISNLILLKEIIEAVTETSFPSFMKKQIFEPLGMYNTAYKSDSLPLPHIAKGYEEINEKHVEVELHNHTLGNQNLYSSVEDMLTWEWNLLHPTPEKKAVVDKIKSIVSLTTGREFSIPQGKLTVGQQFTHKERGIRSDYLSSRMGPYTAAMFNFPDHDLIGVVLSNNNMPYNGYLIMNSAYVLLKDEFTKPAVAIADKTNAPTLTTEQLKKYTCAYYNPDLAVIRRVEIKNDTLLFVRPNTPRIPLIPIDKDKFQIEMGGDDRIIVSFKSYEDKLILDYIVGEAEPISLFRYEPIVKDSADFVYYEGTYLCTSLGIAYHIEMIDNQLYINNPINGAAQLLPVTEDLFTTNAYFMRSLFFHRNPDDTIDGFLIRHFDAWDIWFKKV